MKIKTIKTTTEEVELDIIFPVFRKEEDTILFITENYVIKVWVYPDHSCATIATYNRINESDVVELEPCSPQIFFETYELAQKIIYENMPKKGAFTIGIDVNPDL